MFLKLRGCTYNYHILVMRNILTIVSIATVAQLVERLICNQLVGGSSPLGGSTVY